MPASVWERRWEGKGAEKAVAMTWERDAALWLARSKVVDSEEERMARARPERFSGVLVLDVMV